jgi:Mg2+ and Co2+ transporter CorA
LNIAPEAKLLVECKDIQDELGILKSILHQQGNVLQNMERALKYTGRPERMTYRNPELTSQYTGCIPDDTKRQELIDKIGQQQNSIDLSMIDLTRMDKQAESVNTNLTQVLDLKQKHANALEARFQRDQAQDTARQGQTIMIFTLVTIIFLPMSFIASFFAINIVDFPHDFSNGNTGLPLGYVAKYLFGIGFAVSIPLIAIAFVYTDLEGWIRTARRKLGLGKKRGTGGGRGRPPAAGDLHQIEKHVLIEEPRESMDRFYSRRPARIDTDKTGGSHATDLEMG